MSIVINAFLLLLLGIAVTALSFGLSLVVMLLSIALAVLYGLARALSWPFVALWRRLHNRRAALGQA